MLYEPAATSCLSATLKDTEQPHHGVISNWSVCRFTDVSARLPHKAASRRGACAQVGSVGRRGRKCAAQGSLRWPGGDTGHSERVGKRASTLRDQWRPTCRDGLPTDGDEKMQASKLITISTAAVLIGGTSLAIGHSWQSGQSQDGASTQAPARTSQGNASGSVTKGSNSQAAEQASKLKGSRQSQRAQAMSTPRALIGEGGQGSSTQRGRAIASARGQAMGTQRGRVATSQQPQLALQARHSVRQTAPGGPVYARATASEARASLTPEQRVRLREMARRELPRASRLPEVRVDAVVPRNVQLAPVPGEIARYYPRFRRDQAFLYRNKIVLVNPATSRIVAVVPA
jgi:hypothetical protein